MTDAHVILPPKIYVACWPFWILGRQWSKMAAQKWQDDFYTSCHNKRQENTCWQEIRKKFPRNYMRVCTIRAVCGSDFRCVLATINVQSCVV